jgi:hypothetical protein
MGTEAKEQATEQVGRIAGKDKIREYMKKYGGRLVDYFVLDDDEATARVRFLHTNDQDLEVYLVHEVEVEGKKRYIRCLEDESCPLCQDGQRPAIKVFIYLVDYADQKIKVWERGSTMIEILLGYAEKYGALNTRDYEIARKGKKKDPKTQYMFFPEDQGPYGKFDAKAGKVTEPMDLPERPKTIGRFVLDWSEEEMTEYVSQNKPAPREERSGKKVGKIFT